MRVALLTHVSAMEHDSGRDHPEQPSRISAAVAGVHEAGLTVVELEPLPATRQMLETVHTARYVETIREFCAAGGGALDADTWVSPGSWNAAIRSAGAGSTAVATLRRRDADAAFIAMRPPGHHALADTAMGFCLFNNIAVAAGELAREGERVVIVDWDVHHGNGSQSMFISDPAVLYISWHQFPWYPGTGGEPGVVGAEGTTLNFPWPAGTGIQPYLWTIGKVIAPIIEQFMPDWVLVSAGYDAHRDDPLADLNLIAGDYSLLASALAALAPPGRIIFYLEGGYNLDALTASVAATLQGASSPALIDAPTRASESVWHVARAAARSASTYWML